MLDRYAALSAAGDPVLMFKILVLRALYSLSDEGCEFQIKHRLSFQRFLGPVLRCALRRFASSCLRLVILAREHAGLAASRRPKNSAVDFVSNASTCALRLRSNASTMAWQRPDNISTD
jgi:hypothetical protein